MTKSYSIDLRKRVIAHVNEGYTCRAAAPAQQGRPPGGGKLAPHHDFLIERVEKTPDMTMPELAAELDAVRNVQVSPASLSRFLCAAGFTYKKNTSGHGTRAR